jgi:hypothetical protein
MGNDSKPRSLAEAEQDQGMDRLPPEREQDVQVWARAHGVSSDDLAGKLSDDGRDGADAEDRRGQSDKPSG